MEGKISDLATQMNHLLNNKEHSDVKFLIGPSRKSVYAHRCILAARCPVFNAMFSEQATKNGSSDKDVPLVLSDITPDIFLCVLEFIYTNCVTLTHKTAVHVLAISIEYGLEQLKRLCVQYLCQSVCGANVCDILQASVLYRQEDLCNSALEYIDDNTQAVFKSAGFNELSDEALASILKSSNLQLDELDILASVKEWTTVNAVLVGKPLSEVAKNVVCHVRFHLLGTDELANVEEVNVKDKVIPLELISAAWKYHALKKADKSGSQLMGVRRGTSPRECHKYLPKS